MATQKTDRELRVDYLAATIVWAELPSSTPAKSFGVRINAAWDRNDARRALPVGGLLGCTKALELADAVESRFIGWKSFEAVA